MIAVQTRLTRVPKCCMKCDFYMSRAAVGVPRCGATKDQRVLKEGTRFIMVTKERASWCPLVEVEGEK